MVLHLAIVPVDGLLDAFAGGQGDFDLAVQDEPQFLERIQVVRIADDDAQGPVFLGHRQDRVFPGDRLGHQFHDRGGDVHLAQVDVVQAVFLGDRA